MLSGLVVRFPHGTCGFGFALYYKFDKLNTAVTLNTQFALVIPLQPSPRLQ